MASRAVRRTLILTTAFSAVAYNAAAYGQAQVAPSPNVQSDAPTNSSAASVTPAAPSNGGVEDIVVTARRVNESAQKIPVALTAVSADQLKQANVTSIGQIEKVAPSLQFQQGPSNATGYVVGIRGQVATETVLTQDPSVGIYVDGVYIPRTAGLRGAFVDMARVEVLRGPQGTLYGRNTTGGAVSSYTQDPTEELGGYVRGRLGNYNERDLLGVINLPLSSLNGGLRLVGNLGSNKGFGHDGLGNRLASEDRTYGRASFKAEPTSSLHINVMVDYSNLKTGGEIDKLGGLLPASLSPTGLIGGGFLIQAGAELGINAFAPGGADKIVNIINQQQDVGRYNTSSTTKLFDNGKMANAIGTVGYDLSDVITLKSITGYHFSKADRRTIINGGTSFTGISNHQIQTSRYFSEEAQLLGKLDRLNWVIGGYYGREHGEELALDIFAVPALNPVVTTNEGYVVNKNLSAYAQASFKITPRLTATGGLRYSSERRILNGYNRTNTMTTPATISCSMTSAVYIGDPNQMSPSQCLFKAGATYNTVSWLGSLDYKLSDSALIYAKVSRGFVSGGQNVRGTNSQPASLAPFKPEKATQYEVGEKAELFDRKLRLNLAGYFTNYQDIQRVVNLPPGTVQAVINAASAHIYGFEAEAILRPIRPLTLTASTGYTHAEYREFIDPTLGDRSSEPFSFPKWTYTLAANYVVSTPVGPITANLNWHHISSVDLYPSVATDSQVTQKGYGLLDARLSVKVDAWNAELALFGRNLTKEYYFVAANGLDNFLGYNNVAVGQPRLYGAELTFNF